MKTWHVTLTFHSEQLTENQAFDLLDTLGQYGSVMSLNQANTGGTITITVNSETLAEALAEAITTLNANAATANIKGISVEGAEIFTPSKLEADANQPTYPEVVGYAEIAEMAGVSRQRARQLAKLAGFPTPVINTGQGPLMNKHAVTRWLETRNTRPGRPKKATT